MIFAYYLGFVLFQWLTLGELSISEKTWSWKNEKKKTTFLLVYVFKSFITVYRKTSDSEPTFKDSKHIHKIYTERCICIYMHTDTKCNPTE